MAEADRHIEEEMEAERRRAEDMAEQRKARAAEYAKSYRFMFAMYNDILMHGHLVQFFILSSCPCLM